jgi:hypothetical protein
MLDVSKIRKYRVFCKGLPYAAYEKMSSKITLNIGMKNHVLTGINELRASDIFLGFHIPAETTVSSDLWKPNQRSDSRYIIQYNLPMWAPPCWTHLSVPPSFFAGNEPP